MWVLSRVQLFATPWTVAHQAPLSMGFSQARILEWMDSHSLLQRIFPTQGSKPGLPHCRQILYQLRHTGSLSRQAEWSITNLMDEIMNTHKGREKPVTYIPAQNTVILQNWYLITYDQ